jgi:DNA-binding NarL/FixJ family response regulator
MVCCALHGALAIVLDVARTPDINGGERIEPPADTRVRTLIVDDSEAVIDGLTQLLDVQPYCEVVGAVSDPASAIERTVALRPDVVLQDFSMPGVDPFRLTRELTACSPRPAVLVLSASSDEASARQAIDAGAIGWVLKDDEPERLFAAMLGAVGFGGHDRLVTPAPAADVNATLDARTVWALLRALDHEPRGLTPEEVAGRAVLPVAIAVRYLQRLTARRPALVAPAIGPAPHRRYGVTVAGQREIERLERRIPAHRSAQAI